ncbi:MULTISPECIES: putative quinol monooxygenase [Streptomyces]|uniref:Antibiotic biosynthesis monooxygenase n=1 Tax=Streptomyces gilvifuscus TaxID=1550617 RepID=A0ABT5FZS7_9ACTN|nr:MULTISPECIES: antibiotic biosynthesis monooxygenase [Streptomyces]MBK3644726.1 antibiotic biosynthesis monooxygenase [Streptomyces sp. MBT33]MDC2958039.1 antibiotic biosynthesis monooxygenase [Streptomyces gilvifuscus]
MAYAVVAHYRCAPADEPAVRAALLKMREQTRAEPANEAYDVHAVVDDPGGFLLYERYTDQAGFEAHKAAEHFQELIVKTAWPLLTDRSVTFAESL